MTKRANRGWAWLGAVLGLMIGHRAFAQMPAMPKVPILEGTTYAVIKLDLNKVDGDAMVKWIVDSADKIITDPAEKQQMLPMMQRQFQQLVQAQQVMIKAGAPVVYFAFNEFPPNDGPLIYAPVAAGGDAEAVRALIYSGPGGKQKGPDVAKATPAQRVTVAMPDGVFSGKAEDYQRIKDPHVGAPHLLFALSQAPAAPLQIVAAPTEGLSLLLETMSPQVPAPVDLPMTTFTHGISSALLTMQAPPNAATHIAIQASDPAAAAQLKTVADKMLAMLNSPQMQQQAPAGIDLKSITEALSPKVAENQLTIDLAGEQTALLPLSLIMPQMGAARQNAMRAQSASNMHQMMSATLNYANQNKGKVPDSLDQIKSLMGPAGVQVLTNPRAVNKEPGYIYVRWADSFTQVPKGNVVIYENPAALPPGTATINAAFSDGSVRPMPTAAVLANVKSAPPPGR